MGMIDNPLTRRIIQLFFVLFFVIPLLIVHRTVGVLYDLIKRLRSVFPGNLHQTATEALRIGNFKNLLKFPLNPSHFSLCHLFRTLSENNTEFISPDSRKQVIFTDTGLHRLHKSADVAVTLKMTIAVVDIL